jgi:hypothetical protein
MDGDHLKTLIMFGALLLSMPCLPHSWICSWAQPHTWQTEELLKHPQVQTLTIKNDVSYKKDMTIAPCPVARC